MSAPSLRNFDATAALAAATASGSDTLITIDAGNTILLKNVAVANLHTGDFHTSSEKRLIRQSTR